MNATQNAALNAKITSLVQMAKTNPNAVEYLEEMKRQAIEGRDHVKRQRIELAIRHAMRNVAC